jgi:hypothetical protein
VFRNEGSLTLGAGPGGIKAGAGGGRFENVGSFLASATSGFSVRLIQVPFVNRGTLRIERMGGFNPNTAEIDHLQFVSLENFGTISVAAQSFFGQRVLIVTGDFVQHDTATLHVDIQYNVPRGQPWSDQLFVDGQAMLAGTLEVNYVREDPINDPAAPPLGVAWTVLQFGSRSGDFAQFIDLESNDGVGFARVFDATTLQLVAQADPPKGP